MGFKLKEHSTATVLITTAEDTSDGIFSEENLSIEVSAETFHNIKNHVPRNFKRERNKDYSCFQLTSTHDKIFLQSNYYIGIDWICKEKKRYIHVEPKLNFSRIESFENTADFANENISEEEIIFLQREAEKKINREDTIREVDIIAMLMKIMSFSDVAKKTDQLLLIDWEAAEIPIEQKQDLLTPFLMVRFLNLLQDIARKGLKKSYYKVQENLTNRVKGKILVGQQIKQNVFKNRLTNTVCEYQVFGEDSIENRFLKKVFLFCTQYVENNEHYFKDKNDIPWMINYIRPTFEHIGAEVDIQETKHFKHNPFFKEYKEAIKTGQQILKRFSYNISKTTDEKISTPPFWIDMPKMFELFVYAKFLDDNPKLSSKNFNYQYATYGNSLDFLICAGVKKIVVDTKYKLRYNYSQIHEDIRQVAGYARLNKVKQERPVTNEEIDCLIIYPNPIGFKEKDDGSLNIDHLINEEGKIKAYHKIYKVGILLPILAP